MIEINVDCLNPGCKIKYKVDEVVINIEETLKTMTDEIVRVMNSRELYYKQLENQKVEGLTIKTSDESDEQEIKF